MIKPLLVLLLFCLLLGVATAQNSGRRQVFRNDAPNGDGTVVTTQYTFPGLVQNYWWHGDVLIAHSYGHLFGCRSYCSDGDWESWTEGLPAFRLPIGSSQSQRHKAGEGTVTNVMVPPAAHNLPDLIAVETFAATFLLSTPRGGVRIIGNFSITGVPPSLAAGGGVDVDPFAPRTTTAGGAAALYDGQVVVFAAVYFSPTETGVAAAVLRDTTCHSVTVTCKRFLYIAHPAFNLPADAPFSHWRLVRLPQDIHAAVFGSPLAVPYHPLQLLLLANNQPFGASPFTGRVEALDVAAFLRDTAVSPAVTAVLDHAVVQVVQQGRFTFFVGMLSFDSHSLVLHVSSDNAATRPILADFGSHLFEGTAADAATDVGVQPQEGTIPSDADGETGYSVVDVSENVFINVYRGSRDFQQLWGHTFASGLGGRRYTAALHYNRRHPTNGAVDFHRVQGLDGVIIANTVTNHEEGICRFCRTLQECDENCLFETVLSRDNGQTWQKLAAPESLCPFDGSGDGGSSVHATATGTAKEDCFLHLHGASSGAVLPVFPIVSSGYAPGVIIATGNTGSYLDLAPEGPRQVYISRDAGDSWDVLLDGASLYDTSDYGGLLWGLPTGRATAHLNFSIDEGKTWMYAPMLPAASPKYKFANSIAMPAANPGARHVVAMGFSDVGMTDAIFTVGLGGLKAAQCQGMDTPTDEASDYEIFLPSSYYSKGGMNCLMGQITGYTRKRYGAKCWVPRLATATGSLLLPKLLSLCNCTYDDYECDVGYDRQGEMCVAYADAASQQAAAACSPSGVREVLTGYRRLPNDRCTGAMDLDPKLVACVKRDSLAAGYLSMLALFFFGVWLVLAARYHSNPEFRRYVQNLTRGILSSGQRRSLYRSVPVTEEDADATTDAREDADAGDAASPMQGVDTAASGDGTETVAPAVEPTEPDAPAAAAPSPPASQDHLIELDIAEDEPAAAAPLVDTAAPLTFFAAGAGVPPVQPPAAAPELDDLFGFGPATASPSPPREPQDRKAAW